MIDKTITLPSDTSREAAAEHTRVLREMGFAGRAKLTFDLCEELRQITRAGIRHRHPDYTEQQVTQACLRLILDNDLFEEIFLGCEILP